MARERRTVLDAIIDQDKAAFSASLSVIDGRKADHAWNAIFIS
jgi:hypothetical protein